MWKILNILIGGEQENQSIKTDGICTCLCSSMGSGGGYVPIVVMLNNKSSDQENDSKTNR